MNTIEEKLVSVIVPTHNRSNMLVKAIESIYNQSYKNIEVIIIANGCTDNTCDIVATLQNRFKTITFLNFKESLGGAEARNKGLDITKGEYIAFLDDDDEWLENKLVKQVEILENSDYCIVGCNYNEVYPSKIKKRDLKEKISFYDMNFENVLGSYSFCITKKEYIGNLRINKYFKANQDYDLWLKILQHTEKEAYIIQEYLVNYYQHSEKISTNYTNKLDAQNNFILYWQDKFSKDGLNYQYMKKDFFSFMSNKNYKYIFKLPSILKAIIFSPYRFNIKKYYVYMNFSRYL